jgi:endonuclease/exonuclease/phosphatase family metal-dependent hydrolase
MRHLSRRSRLRIIIISCFALPAAAFAAIYAVAPSLSAEAVATPPVKRHSAAFLPPAEKTATDRNVLKVMTLNIGHGKGAGHSQLLQNSDSIRSNLDEIAAVLRRESPAIAAVQEADAPSIWSGNIDQVAYLAQKAGYAYSLQARHVKSRNISYGTGLLSTPPLTGPLAITFDASPPTFSKGFLIATIDWPADPNIKLDVVSVHLDFLRKTVRERQVRDMVDRLAPRARPLIIMGDFNCQWSSNESAVRTLAQKLNLKAYQPTDPDMDTFTLLGTRIDWILISADLKFVKYRLLPDVISDHHAVVAEITMTDQSPSPQN